jgi:hypothetical protein
MEGETMSELYEPAVDTHVAADLATPIVFAGAFGAISVD